MSTRYVQRVVRARHEREQYHLATVHEMVEKLSNQRDILVAQEAAIKELSEEVKRLKKKLERASRLDGKGHAV